jgi:hypothetical protein
MGRPSKKLPKDQNQNKSENMYLSKDDQEEESTPAIKESSKVPLIVSQYFSAIGYKGGLKGGKARAAKLSAKRRKSIAKKAALTRWKKSSS